MQTYRSPRSRKQRLQVHQSKMRGGKLMPVGIVPFLPNESGTVSMDLSVEMEPIAGRLISDILMHCVSVYVPILAVDEFIGLDELVNGNTELMRKRMIDGDMLFPLEAETEITKRMGIEPMSIGGQLLTSSVSRLAHNVAVNYLRRRIYAKASQLSPAESAITPALLSTTAVDRFNGVLQPEDRINGAVTLEGQIPVSGIGLRNVGTAPGPLQILQSDGKLVNGQGWIGDPDATGVATNRAQIVVHNAGPGGTTPNIHVDFADAQGSALSLKQFYLAQRQDAFIRECARIIDERPEDGHKLIARLIHGFEIDPGKQPFVLFEQTIALGAGIQTAMDGPSLDVQRTNTSGRITFARPVPQNEFGGIVITFLSVKPEEVIANQPDPVLSHAWGVRNYVADDLRIDPEPVYRRQLDSDVPPGNEDDVMFWVGPNHFERTYQRYNWSRDVNVETVDHKSARWRYAVPVGVDPDNVIYPQVLDHYPFVLNSPTDAAASYVVKIAAEIASPVKLGPTPVENLDLIEEIDIFDEE